MQIFLEFFCDFSHRRASPDYGNNELFKKVLDEAHARGMKVIMDLVVNHTSDQHEWFQKSRQRIDPYTDYYIWRPGRGKDGKKFPNNWMATFPGDGWKWNEERGEYYLHLFAVEQPDLNHDNPAVREEVKKIITDCCNRAYPYYEKMSIAFPKIKFRKMVSRWGSCHNVKKVLTFNTQLMYAPYECIEYVVWHEFTHFLQPNHSKKFYNQLAMFMPDWQERKNILEKNNSYIGLSVIEDEI